MPGEEVRQIEGGRLLVVHRLPPVVPGEEAVAVSPREPLDAVAVEHLVERATRAAVGVGDEDALVAPSELVELRVDGGAAISSGVEWSFAGRHGR